MAHFGLIIDESGTPGLYKSVEDAKKQVETEMIEFFGAQFWANYGCYAIWSYPIDASYETPAVYLGDDNWLSDDFQVWDVMLGSQSD